MARILVISNDLIGEKMAGSAIRCYEISRVLSKYHEVTLTAAESTGFEKTDFKVQVFDQDASKLKKIAEQNDILIIPAFTLSLYPFLKDLGKILVMDIYVPIILEQLEVIDSSDLELANTKYLENLKVIKDQLLYGDFFMCANRRQRDFWLGMLAAWQRINPKIYKEDPTLESLIAVVPFGISEKPPQHSGANLARGGFFQEKELRGCIKDEDFLLLWGGGVWNWFDPLTLLKAMELLKNSHPEIKLLFAGVQHPHPKLPKAQYQVLEETIEKSKISDLYNKTVFFHYGWVPYRERQNYLLEADAGVSTHKMHLETYFSFRTRILDYIWAGLPIITTKGDTLADLVEKERLGLTVQEAKPEELAEAILTVAKDAELRKAYKENLARMAPNFYWSQVLKPLLDFCENPSKTRNLSENSYKSREILEAGNKNNYPNQTKEGKNQFQKLRKIYRWFKI